MGIAYICDSEKSLEYCISGIRLDWDNKKYLIVKTQTGRDRTLEQNKLSCRMYQLLSKFGYFDSFNDAKAHCKLYYGVNIMMEDEEFAASIELIKRAGLTVEEKLTIMLEPIDLPVTRLMNREQFCRYRDKIISSHPKIDWDKHIGKEKNNSARG